jgi:hypothetical protein
MRVHQLARSTPLGGEERCRRRGRGLSIRHLRVSPVIDRGPPPQDLHTFHTHPPTKPFKP